ncbi:ABC-type amino acid transport substrate-binding protein [Marinobacter sp. es.048]|uniref:substrate-binding periplasmic protein n=1 Tax=Marinobacter sp. es.048 TaxID=1761795 RepID=UPI000B592F96|nr:transporter substrate-binding domain-containing protein [Marinobacter sp. es.048]SNC65243.1 ABC-type amino acid transport substrate-binding protein [Marinobacter sp. es.048]
MNLRLALSLTLILASPVCQAQPPTLNLYTFESPPYQVASQGKDGANRISGETADTVVCAANRAGWATRIRITPQNRAMHSLERNMIDGYFAIDPSAELDNIAKRSDPVALEKWYFFTRGDQLVSDNLRIGVVDGSNEEAWLEANDYSVFLSVTSASQLLALLKRERIDAALMDERVMNGLLLENGGPGMVLERHFVRYAPLYLYLSESFASSYPEFLGTFNRTLNSCMAGHLALSDEEERRIRTLSENLISEVSSALDIPQIIASGPRQESFTDVMTQDSMWQAMAPFASTQLADRILALAGSRTLHGWKVAQGGLVTEAMIMNSMGTLAAMSQLTTDYWQGDEAKFQKVLDATRQGLKGMEALYISPIRYDASTSRFQVTVSAPVSPISDGVPLGVLMLGLDAEDALRALERP